MSFNDATRGELKIAFNRALKMAGVPDVKVYVRDFSMFGRTESGLEFTVAPAMADGMGNCFNWGSLDAWICPNATIQKVAEYFAKAVACSIEAGDEITLRVNEARSLWKNAYAQPGNAAADYSFIKLEIEPLSISMWDTQFRVYIQTADYDRNLQLRYKQTYFGIDADFEQLSKAHSEEQHRRRSRSCAFRSANAAGVIDAFTLRLLASHGVKLGDVLAELGEEIQLNMTASSISNIPGMRIRRQEGVMRSCYHVNDQTWWAGNELYVYQPHDEAMLTQAARGIPIGKIVDFGLFADEMIVLGLQAKPALTEFEVASPLVYFSANGTVLGPAPHMEFGEHFRGNSSLPQQTTTLSGQYSDE